MAEQGPLQRSRQRLLALVRRAEDGVSALEFAFLAMILVPGLLLTADVGLAIHARMNIDHVLRAGAQSAMDGKSLGAIQLVLDATAAGTSAEPRVEQIDGTYRLTAWQTYPGLLRDREPEKITLYVQIP